MRLAFALSFALAACVGGSLGPGKQEDVHALAEGFRYEVQISDDLRTLDATLCFDGPTPKVLRAGKSEASSRLRYVRWLSPGPIRRLSVERGRVQLDPSRHNGCIAYGVDLADGGSLGAVVKHIGSSLLASPNAWLLRPEQYTKDARVELSFRRKQGQELSLPWTKGPQNEDSYQLDTSTFRFDSHAAFGQLRKVEGKHAGVAFEVVVLGNALALDATEIATWMRGAIDMAQHGPGGFPKARLHVLVVPSDSTSEAVSFGSVTRGGTGSVLLFVGRAATLSSLQRDWVLPHELSHLFLPFLPKVHAWFNEGAATYYQEILRARAKVLTEREALANLAQSMRSAAREGHGRTLREESARMFESHAFRTVYWGGAAFFLMADVALRSEPQGAHSLDSVLQKLRENHAGIPDFSDIDALLQQLDEIAGVSVFVPLATSCLAQPFPDVEHTLQRLGMALGESSDEDFSSAELAHIRSALFGEQSSPQ